MEVSWEALRGLPLTNDYGWQLYIASGSSKPQLVTDKEIVSGSFVVSVQNDHPIYTPLSWVKPTRVGDSWGRTGYDEQYLELSY